MSTGQDTRQPETPTPAPAPQTDGAPPPAHVHHHREETEGQRVAEEIGNAFDRAETGVANEESATGHHHHSTFGLKIFDYVLFNLTNLAVFALSVYSTYKSNFSQPKDTPLEKQNWWMKRGNQVRGFLHDKLKMPEEAAKNANMVLWSFLDGSVMAPFVALVEHNRTRIGRWIDNLFGTTPQDKSVYEEQPKQGWKSVFLGRLSAFSIVIPTYFLLNIKDKNDPNSKSLNNILFDEPANAAVKHNVSGIRSFLEKRRFTNDQIKGLVNSGIFEVFYTTVCTTILFLVSAFTGRKARERTESDISESKITRSKKCEKPAAIHISDSAPDKKEPIRFEDRSKNVERSPERKLPETDQPVISEDRLEAARARREKPAPVASNGYAEMRNAERNNATPVHLAPAS